MSDLWWSTFFSVNTNFSNTKIWLPRLLLRFWAGWLESPATCLGYERTLPSGIIYLYIILSIARLIWRNFSEHQSSISILFLPWGRHLLHHGRIVLLIVLEVVDNTSVMIVEIHNHDELWLHIGLSTSAMSTVLNNSVHASVTQFVAHHRKQIYVNFVPPHHYCLE